MTSLYDERVNAAKDVLEGQPAVLSAAMNISIEAATAAWLNAILSERNRIALFLNGMEKSFSLPLDEAVQFSALESILAEHNIEPKFDL